MCLKLKRKPPYRLLTSFYYPTIAFALLSMLSFLINPDIVSKNICSNLSKIFSRLNIFSKVPGRMGMIVTLYLIHTNVYNSVEAPDNREFSYIELWMIGTQLPILLALIEYGIILYWKRISKKAIQIQQENGNDLGVDIDETIKKLDLISMITIFLCFITFTLFYIVATTNLNSR